MKAMILFAAVLMIPAGPGILAAPPIIVENPADPPLVETWTLREVWRLDCEEDDSLPLIGVVTQATVDDAGHVLLLDSQLGRVLEIGPDGEYLGVLGRQGQGPGELERPNTLFLAGDGILGLLQGFPGKVVFLNRDDTPAGSMTVQGNNPVLFVARKRAGNLVMSGQTQDFDRGSRSSIHDFIARFDSEGTPVTTFLESDREVQYDPPVSDEAKSWFPTGGWAQAPDGSVLIPARRDSFIIDWFEPTGELRLRIARDFAPHRRSGGEKDEVARGMRMWGPGGELEPRRIVSETDPALRKIACLRDGGFWVESCFGKRGLPEGVFLRYDLFDAEGRLVKEVRLFGEIDLDTDHFAPLADGRFLWFRSMKSALAALYAGIEDGGKDESEESVPVQIVLMERAS